MFARKRKGEPDLLERVNALPLNAVQRTAVEWISTRARSRGALVWSEIRELRRILAEGPRGGGERVRRQLAEARRLVTALEYELQRELVSA
jgi:hypothetical protein